MKHLQNKGWTILNAMMAILFLLAAGLQYNDRDSLRWIFIYGGAAFASVLWFSSYFKRIIPLLILAAALLWAAFLFPDVLDHGLSMKQSMQSFKMVNFGVEQSREFGGLVIVVIWMGILSLWKPEK